MLRRRHKQRLAVITFPSASPPTHHPLPASFPAFSCPHVPRPPLPSRLPTLPCPHAPPTLPCTTGTTDLPLSASPMIDGARLSTDGPLSAGSTEGPEVAMPVAAGGGAVKRCSLPERGKGG